MTGLVLDASVAIAWFLPDESTEGALRLRALIETDGAVVPAHWRLETLNGLLMAARRGRYDEAELESDLRDAETGGVALDMSGDWLAVAAVAQKHRLTAYDAAYLELAMRLSLPLATFDKQLIAAANAEQVVVLSL